MNIVHKEGMSFFVYTYKIQNPPILAHVIKSWFVSFPQQWSKFLNPPHLEATHLGKPGL